MGYDLHITRCEDHFESCDDMITEKEWKDLVRDDPTLRFSDAAGTQADWYPDGIPEGEPPSDWYDTGTWFDFDEETGTIYTKNPEPKDIRKMTELAGRLGAKVQGDDGEIYLANGECRQTLVNRPTLWEWLVDLFLRRPRPEYVDVCYRWDKD